jgi:TonB-linked SusC/RagA family outer membrane protein
MKKLLFVLCIIFTFSIFSEGIFAQKSTTYVIEGTVYDEKGEAFVGVSVYMKNKVTIGTTTDVDGKFSIKAERGDVLVFSFIGYEKVEYLVTEQPAKSLEIRFTETSSALDEVIVTALGSQRKISSLGAISSVEVKDLQTPAVSVTNLLGGRVSGIISMQTSGEPGKNISEFWIRGIGTFGANAGALVLIDGLEGDINSIDAADIESFSVLKDASATAVYGVRGANGVVLVTTKKGTPGKLSITGRVNYTISHLSRIPKYLRAYDYALLANEAREVRNETPIYTPIELDIIQDGSDLDLYPDVSWQDEILNRNFFRQSYYVSARGGAEVAKYFISLGGSNETAAYKVDKNSPYASNVGYGTYNYRANIDLELSKTSTLYFGTDGFLAVRNNPGVANTDYIWQAQTNFTPLLFPTVYSNGQYPAEGSSGAGGGAMTSPYVMINRLGRRSEQEFQGKFTLAFNQDLSMLIDGLKFKLQGAYDITSWFSESRFITPALYQAVGRDKDGKLVTIQRIASQPASYDRGTDQYRKYHFESTVNYDKVFNDVNRVSALVYYYISDQKKASDGNSNLSAIPVRYQGVSSRLTYGYNDTYMIDLNFGYTGSENFQPGRQYGFFPSVALGWVPTGYDFVKEKLPWLTLLKFRGSYGTVGNDRISQRRFPYLTMVNTSSVGPWGSSGVEGVSESVMGADNLQWEKAIKADFGIEAGLLDERVKIVVDIFKDQRNGIFQQRVQIPGYVGLTTLPFGNIGKMQSYGSDGSASYTHIINEDMNFTVRGNFTYSRNNVQNWEESNPKYPYQEVSGYPLGSVRGLIALGLFKDETDIETSPVQNYGAVMPGDIKYLDVNGDGQIDSDDRVPLSYNTIPLLMYGFGGEYRYRQFTLGVLFKGTGKTDYFRVGQYYTRNNATYINGSGYVPFHDGVMGNVLTMTSDPNNRWIPKDYAARHGIDPALAENPNALFPRLQHGYNNNNSQLSTFWKGDSRYLRLQEVTLNYNLKLKALKKAGVSSIDLQLVGNNLYIWDKVKTFDPEQAVYDGVVYPIPTSYAFQLYINL